MLMLVINDAIAALNIQVQKLGAIIFLYFKNSTIKNGKYFCFLQAPKFKRNILKSLKEETYTYWCKNRFCNMHRWYLHVNF